MADPTRRRLRGTTLLAAPLFLIGVIAATLLVATALWGVWNDDHLGVSFWSVLIVTAVVALAGFVAARGCFVEVDERSVRDVVGWVTVRRLPRREIATVRVRAGAWRWFEVEMQDASLHVLVGAGPAQLPARLLPASRDDDLAALDLILGDD